MDYPIVGEKECGTSCLLLLASAVCMVLLGVFALSKVAANEHPLCRYFEELATYPGVSVAQWREYPNGWMDMPLAWDYERWTPTVYPSGILTRGYKSIRWMWAFKDLDVTSDSNGNHEGTHNFCEHVLIVSDAQ